MKLNKTQQKAINYYSLDFAESDEPGAGWFAYTTDDTRSTYPGSSCECIEDVADWYIKELHAQAGTQPPPF